MLLSLLGVWLFLKEFYFSAVLVSAAIISFAVSIYYDRKKLIDRIERLIAGIRHSDFSTHFINSNSNDELNRLSHEMNEALEIFATVRMTP